MRARGMVRKSAWAVALVLAAGMAAADVVRFPAGGWDGTRLEMGERGPVVKDAKGAVLLRFNTEGGDFGRLLVVSQAVDHLAIDANAAFKAGMVKLVLTGADFSPKPYGGRECTLVTTWGGPPGTAGAAYFEGHAKGMHFHNNRKLEVRSRSREFWFVTEVPENLDRLHLRWDVTRTSARGPLRFYGARYAAAAELPPPDAPPVAPQLLFHAPFDGSAAAEFAKGAARPVRADGLEFAEGCMGKAVRLTRAARSALEYEVQGNLAPERGTVSLWFKREWPDTGRDGKGGEIWRTLFANPSPQGERIGSGQLCFWWWGERFRADQGDLDDAFAIWQGAQPKADDWNHLAVTWDETGVRIYMNGRSGRGVRDGDSPMKAALQVRDRAAFSREVFKTFCVGSQDGRKQFDGLVDELRIYSAPLSPAQIRELWRRGQVVEMKATGLYALENVPGTVTVSATSPSGHDLSGLHYCMCDAEGKVVSKWKDPVGKRAAKLTVCLPAGVYTLKATDGERFYGGVQVAVLGKDNPYELSGAEAVAARAKGAGRLANVELVSTLRMDRTPPPDRFRAVGPVRVRHLNGAPYLEAGEKAGNRFALRFSLPTNTPLYLFEIDYPDDSLRTADLIIQQSKMPHGDYTMQVGYAAGDEYPNTGRMLTHRCLYWAKGADVTLVAMTARDGAPAAVGAVRIYRVRGAALPPAPVKAATSTPRRTVALYFEDPAIGYDFGVGTGGFEPQDLDALIDRTAALMKFTGANTLAYPGAWYHGLIGEDYNPRRHAPDFLSAWYAKFDREGLGIFPTLNVNTMPVPERLVTRKSMRDGSLHDSAIAIHDTGKPNWGGWHGTPPNFNFYHPAVRRYLGEAIDALVDQGAGHSSFRGVCMHLTRHCLAWFGDAVSGYNDYAVEAFAREKGLKLPKELRQDPLRGKAYAEWLRKNAWDAWVQWRCDQVTDFYVRVARRLAERRADLKLWINYMMPADVHHPDFTHPDFIARSWREAGLDSARLAKEVPNLILGQTMVPADYRHRRESAFPTPEARAHQRVLDTEESFYSQLRGAAYPLVHQHDRYWESPIGAGGAKNSPRSLSCDWLNECPWRVSTINPAGVHALRHFVEPLRWGDVLGLSKGGFLIGTYGMEEQLVPFLLAFRALPAVVFDDAGSACGGTVRMRQKTCYGRSWFYVVNTGMKPASVDVEFPSGTRDLVTGERVGPGGGATRLALGPYELRSYAAPEGKPVILR